MRRRTFIRTTSVATSAILLGGLMDVRGNVSDSGTESGDCKSKCKIIGSLKPSATPTDSEPIISYNPDTGKIEAHLGVDNDGLRLEWRSCTPGKTKCKLYFDIYVRGVKKSTTLVYTATATRICAQDHGNDPLDLIEDLAPNEAGIIIASATGTAADLPFTVVKSRLVCPTA